MQSFPSLFTLIIGLTPISIKTLISPVKKCHWYRCHPGTIFQIIAHGQNLPVQILIRGKRVRSASSGSVVYVRSKIQKFRNCFSRVFNSLSTGIQARRLRYFRFSDLQKYFLDLFIMLNKSFISF